jgi:hypothetical protein
MIRPLGRWTASEAVALMMRPRQEYARRVSESRDAPWHRALLVPGLLTLLFGIVTSASATGRVVASLVISQTVCWSFVPALQLITGSTLIASARPRPVSFPRAVELLFAAHGPWSLWLVTIAGFQMITPNQNPVLVSVLAPAAWTAWIMLAFTREVLAMPPGKARMRVLAHQAVTLLLILAYVELASRLSVRIIGALQR